MLESILLGIGVGTGGGTSFAFVFVKTCLFFGSLMYLSTYNVFTLKTYFVCL